MYSSYVVDLMFKGPLEMTDCFSHQKKILMYEVVSLSQTRSTTRTRNKALENFTRCCAHYDEVSLFLSFFLSFSLTLGCPVLLVFFARRL